MPDASSKPADHPGARAGASRDDELQEQALQAELSLVEGRRARIDALAAAAARGATRQQPPGTPTHWGLALSGGGIRSATFALGVLQAVAESPSRRGARDEGAPEASPGTTFKGSRLSDFDYLSTVSGGGYIGAFLCGLFVPGRLREGTGAEEAADDAARVLRSGAPGRIHSDADYSGEGRLKAPLAWLRENGRYLAPTGFGDAVYAAGLSIRNWISLHVVVGTVLLALLALLALARAQLLPWTHCWETGWFEAARHAAAHVEGWSAALVWWSPVLLLVPVLLAAWTVPCGVAYWCNYQRADDTSAPLNRAVWCGLAVAVGLAVCAGWDAAGAPSAGAGCGRTLQRWWLWALGAAMAFIGVAIAMVVALRDPRIAEQRVLLTRHLASSLVVVGSVLGLGLVDTASQTLYLLSHAEGPGVQPLLTPAAMVAALVWLAKKGAASLGKPAVGSRLRKLPLTALGGIAGGLILFLMATLWGVVIHVLAWSGGAPSGPVPGGGHGAFLWALLGASVVLAALVGQFPGFINLSSLQSFYSARIVRAYLGGSNGKRFAAGGASLSVAEPIAGDNLVPQDYLTADSGANAPALRTLAPLHIVNVTLNKTVDPAEQLVQRDRKGQPLAVFPFGFSVDGWRHPFPDHQSTRGWRLNEVERPLSVGQWVGTSGAAIATGIGRETSLGMSLLMGAANVRLGVWWDSGRGKAKAEPGLLALLTTAVGAVFRTQTYLSYEFRARFFGMRRKWQYLSDGGHFENTALYELLRPERRVHLAVASDSGADPNYAFGDLANLIRLVRIDFGLELSVVRDFKAWPTLAGVFGAPEDFAPGPPPHTRCAVLLRAAPRGSAQASRWVVLLKPVVGLHAQADILQYKRQRPAFPQEPTMDQFFDEAQWESYRSLGHSIASRVLATEVWSALETYMRLNATAPAS